MKITNRTIYFTIINILHLFKNFIYYFFSFKKLNFYLYFIYLLHKLSQVSKNELMVESLNYINNIIIIIFLHKLIYFYLKNYICILFREASFGKKGKERKKGHYFQKFRFTIDINLTAST